MPAPATRMLLPTALSVAFALFASWVDVSNSEVQAAVLVLLVAGMIIGALWPQHAWLWALLLGVTLPLGDYLLPRLGAGTSGSMPFNAGAFLALAPAFIGTYSGVLVRRLLGALRG